MTATKLPPKIWRHLYHWGNPDFAPDLGDHLVARHGVERSFVENYAAEEFAHRHKDEHTMEHLRGRSLSPSHYENDGS